MWDECGFQKSGDDTILYRYIAKFIVRNVLSVDFLIIEFLRRNLHVLVNVRFGVEGTLFCTWCKLPVPMYIYLKGVVKLLSEYPRTVFYFNEYPIRFYTDTIFTDERM